jgi:hypothetical protein
MQRTGVFYLGIRLISDIQMAYVHHMFRLRQQRCRHTRCLRRVSGLQTKQATQSTQLQARKQEAGPHHQIHNLNTQTRQIS